MRGFLYSVGMAHVNPKRVRAIGTNPGGDGPVIWWPQRDQRLRDNWAALYAFAQAKQRKVPLIVCFALVPVFLEGTLRQYDFMLRGLEELERDLRERNIPFHLLIGSAPETIPAFAKQIHASLIVTDFNPLRIARAWKDSVAQQAACPVHEVDAHNIVPCWIASDKREVGARTLRPKISRLLPEYLEEFPHILPRNTESITLPHPVDWQAARASLRVDESIEPVTWITPGEKAAQKALDRFIEQRLNGYGEGRNDPTEHHQSDLSPYFHFGHLSPQRVALAVQAAQAPSDDRTAYIEELVIRRELSDNFCYYQPDYDSPDAFPGWARTSLDLHAADVREHTYTREQLENAGTHDDLWNAAQNEMRKRGKMHGYLRMYWAKKILEWSPTYHQAQQTAIYLNDRYFLDGRDPNGYTGIAWSIGGLHDRPWFDRPIYGVVRYMNRNGAARKFDIAKYVAWVNSLDEGGNAA